MNEFNNMKRIAFIFTLIILLYAQNNLLYKGIFTETGYGHDENNNQLNSGISYSYYVRIYTNVLIITTVQYGTGQTIDLKYQYKGKNKKNKRIYDDNISTSYVVDNNYNLTKVLSSPSIMYGNNVQIKSFWNLVKGEKYKAYNNRHNADGSSYESKYQNNSGMFNFLYD